jgi:hypothetical protein
MSASVHAKVHPVATAAGSVFVDRVTRQTKAESRKADVVVR